MAAIALGIILHRLSGLHAPQNREGLTCLASWQRLAVFTALTMRGTMRFFESAMTAFTFATSAAFSAAAWPAHLGSGPGGVCGKSNALWLQNIHLSEMAT